MVVGGVADAVRVAVVGMVTGVAQPETATVFRVTAFGLAITRPGAVWATRMALAADFRLVPGDAGRLIAAHVGIQSSRFWLIGARFMAASRMCRPICGCTALRNHWPCWLLLPVFGVMP